MWNVKGRASILLPGPSGVLIETLWNVKLNGSLAAMRATGINRNIVECKVASAAAANGSIAVLIETLWNVKESIPEVIPFVIGINRNIVECKGK